MKNILEYLERTAAGNPSGTAVDDGRCSLCWKELTEKAREYGRGFAGLVKPRQPVAVIMEKSAQVLAAMFGIVYAGCFYVMIDPRQPVDRIREILRILDPKLIVAEEALGRQLEHTFYGERVYSLQEILKGSSPEGRLKEIRENSSPEDLLYALFTSGSTGTPKGVAVSHQAVIHFISHFTEIFEIGPSDRIGNQAPFDFDVSVKDIYSSVMTGAELVLIPKEYFATPPRLLDYLCEKQITTLIWAVSALCLITTLKGLSYRVPESVKKVLFSGEVMPPKQLRAWRAALPEAKFVNLYGPTEITCNCTYYPVDRNFQDAEKIPIGCAFPGREVFLSDDENRPIAVAGTIGEICVAGESLSEGYYRNPGETARRFVYMPTEKQENGRCYLTGDLGYYDKDGQLYFAGRKDFQIKHMGHRIELEEIERAMNQVIRVERCCCIHDAGRNRIVAFYMGEAVPAAVRAALKKKVPGYMVPNKIYQVDTLPLNKNGKIDRKRLQMQAEA